MYNKDFNKKHMKFLYARGEEHLQGIKRWSSLKEYDLASMYQNKLEAVVELMESIQCFHVGLGKDADNYGNVFTRFNSFKEYK